MFSTLQSFTIKLFEHYREGKLAERAIPFVFDLLQHNCESRVKRLLASAALGLDDGISMEFSPALLENPLNFPKINWCEAGNRDYWETIILPTLSRERYSYCANTKGGSRPLLPERRAVIQERILPQYQRFYRKACDELSIDADHSFNCQTEFRIG